MRRVGVVWLILATLLVLSIWAKSDNANSKSEDKCNNGLGNDKEKCYEGDKADSINGNAYGLSTNKFADSSDDSLADEETQQANEETLTEFEEVHQTVAENFLTIKEIPPEIEIISQEPQYVNGEVVARVYNLGTKATTRAIDEVSGYMVMSLNEGDVPIKAYSFDTKYEDLYEPYREFLNFRLYEMKKAFASKNLRTLSKSNRNKRAWEYLKNYKKGDPLPPITSSFIDFKKGKVDKSKNKNSGKNKRGVNNEPLIVTNWGQENPYNAQMYRLPEKRLDRDGNKTNLALTGCTPTSWAQIMKYHQWPPRGVGVTEDYSYMYDTSITEMNITGVDLNHGFDYNWSDEYMYLEYEYVKDVWKEYEKKEYYNVALLMSDISYSQKCFFKKYRTGCPTSIEKIIKHFGYSINMDKKWYKVGVIDNPIYSQSEQENALSEYATFKTAVSRDINNSMPLQFVYIYNANLPEGSEIDGILEGNITITNPINLNFNENNVTFLNQFSKVFIETGEDSYISIEFGNFTRVENGIEKYSKAIETSDGFVKLLSSKSVDISNEEKNIIIEDGKVHLVVEERRDSHGTVVDGYEDINDTSFAIRINIGWYGNHNNFYTFSDEDRLLLETTNNTNDIHSVPLLTNTVLIHNILPCYRGSEYSKHDCDDRYVLSLGKVKRYNFRVDEVWELKALQSNKIINSSYFKNASEVWSYDKNASGEKEWILNPAEIKPRQGFWIKQNSQSTYFTVGNSDESTTFTKIEEVDSIIDENDKSWYLLGTGLDMNTTDIFSGFEIFSYVDSVWLHNPKTIEAGYGFWVRRSSDSAISIPQK